MTEEDVVNLLKNEIAEKTDVDPSTIDETVHLADLGIDSLQALQLLVLLERECDLTFEDSDLQHFRSIRSVAALVASRMPAVVAQTAGEII